MSGSHKEFPKKAVYVQLGLAALVGIGFLFAEKPPAHAMTEGEVKPIVEAAAKILAPVGKVEVKEETMASAARSGEEIYTSTCGTCHDNGIAGAPKLDDKASWETRLSDGFSALVVSAIKGKGAMPARGGNPDITDSEMELTVSHMIKGAGIELVAKSAAGNASTTATTPEAEVMKAEEAPKAEEAVEAKNEEAPKVEETVEAKTEEAPKVEETVETKTEDAPKVEETVEAKTGDVKTEAVAAVTTTAAAVDHSAGEAIYNSSCFACHASGVAGSPKLGDKIAWASRIAAGTDSLYSAAINGKGAMPAKGGNNSISDDDIKAAVDYMAAKSK